MVSNNEIWKDIKGFENKYQVSNLGRVRSLYFNRIKIRKPILNKNGYYYISLSDRSNNIFCKTIKIHRLVAETFLPNPNKLKVVNHIDENKANNVITNLEWCDHLYNTRYSMGKPVLQYTLDGTFIAEYSAIREAASKTECTVSGICACCSKLQHKTRNYIWKLKHENN